MIGSQADKKMLTGGENKFPSYQESDMRVKDYFTDGQMT